MRPWRLVLLAAAFGGAAWPAHGGGLVLVTGTYGYAPPRGPGRLRVSAGFSYFGPPYGHGFGPGPYGPVGFASSVTTVKVITVAPPPVLVLRPSLVEPEGPPGEIPDVPVPRIRRGPPKGGPPPGKEVPPPPPPVPPPPPRIPPPSDDPAAESARLVTLGRDDFKEEQYGRAVQRFRAASRLLPDEPMPYFLLAQALVALGKYHEALDATLAGMDRQPDWPAARFRPIDLYGDAAGEYPEHLARLAGALERHPDDAVLLFLNGHQGWFAGRKGDAALLFRRALDRLAGREGMERRRRACERFLREWPAGPKL